jgi:hypothetical protein
MNKEVIPEEYRNRLYSWEGGGYDGCIWEINFGYVSDKGDWVPFHSTGRDGLDDHGWYEKKIFNLRVELNLGIDEVTEKFKEERAKIREELRVRHNQIFLEQIEAQKEVEGLDSLRNWAAFEAAHARHDWTSYPIDDEHSKESCKDLFERLSSNPGLACSVIDTLADAGYAVWGTCSDCGDQFQAIDLRYSDMLDANSYHGDGGIGCVYTRVLCDDCRENVTCPRCLELTLPNPAVANAKQEYYWFYQQFIYDWIGVCDQCADSFFDQDEYKHWKDDITNLEIALKKTDSEEDKQKLVEGLREKMKDDVKEFFKDDACYID